MLTIAKISASKSEALTQYYERTAGREDYYQKGGEPPGQWLGKGAENLGLAGMIEEGDLGKIMAGFHPKTGEALTRNAGEDDRAPAWDCTFSAPKTVSAEWAVAGREVQLEIQRAHDEAVKSAAEYLEREAVTARRGHAGEIREQTKGIVVATYQHSTSRNGDPQLHTHTIIMNMGERQDGSWGNIDLDTRHKMAAGALYRAELAENLRQQGFQIERDGDSFKIKGVPDDLAQTWSSRHDEIKDAMKKAGTSGYLSSIQASLQTRATKGEINRQEFMQDWKKQAAELGFTQKEAENLKDDIPARPLNKPDANQMLQTLTEQQSTFSNIQMLHEAAKAAQGAGMTAKDAETFSKEVLNREDVVKLENQKGDIRYTTIEMLDLEKRMADTALKMKENTNHRINNQTIEEAVKGKGLSDEQLDAIHHITHETGGIAAVEGWAGTGKSTMLNAAREAWENAGYQTKGAALAGKAAEGLEQSAGIQSQTIHSLIKEVENGQATLDKKTVLVIDEAGMIGSRQMEKLVRACDKAGAKLVLVGDSKQLQAIDAGAAFRAVADKIGRFEMQDVKRQQHAADREMAKAFREGRAGAALQNLDERGRLIVTKDQQKAREEAVAGFVRDAKKGKSTAMFAATRKEVRDLNLMAREKLKEAGLIRGEDIKMVVSNGIRDFAAGDRIVFTRNSKQFNVKNGTQAIVTEVDKKMMTVMKEDGSYLRFDHNKLPHFDHAYGLTVHKGQGATVDKAHIIGNDRSGKEWWYTAASRARESTEVYASKDLMEIKNYEKSELERSMSRSQAKDTTLDYQKSEKEPEAAKEKEQEKGREYTREV